MQKEITVRQKKIILNMQFTENNKETEIADQTFKTTPATPGQNRNQSSNWLSIKTCDYDRPKLLVPTAAPQPVDRTSG